MTTTRDPGESIYDAPETRLRIGLANCTELLVDLPNYYHANMLGGIDGASNLGPAIKHQFPDWITGLTLSSTVGVFLNTGNPAIAGSGPNPYAQLPWSYDLGNDWSINGMFGALQQRHEINNNTIYQSTFYLDHGLNDKSDIFIEYVNNYQQNIVASNTIGVGGSYRFMPHQQVDFKLGSGWNNATPNFYFSIGYSLRFDRVF
jgi:hypothetical protein